MTEPDFSHLALQHRLQWLSPRHPAPKVHGMGSDDQAQWLITAAVPGEPAVGDTWRARRPEAIRAIATGLRALHAIDIDDTPPFRSAERDAPNRCISLRG